VKFKIRNRFSWNIIFTLETKSLKLAVEAAVVGGTNLTEAYLAGANLTGAHLAEAYLAEANLTGAHLAGAELAGAYLTGAYLTGANLTGADLAGAHLAGANLAGAELAGAHLAGAELAGANLTGAHLTGAHLTGAHLAGAHLAGAKIKFIEFPSITFISTIRLHELSDNLTSELMRRDCWAHPKPKEYQNWADGKNNCPYDRCGVERFWLFKPKRDLWDGKPPQMRDNDLILAICKEKGWKIKGYLK